MVRSSPAGAQHRWCSFILILLASLAAFAGTGLDLARAQAPSLGNVPNDIKNATDISPHKAQIQTFLINATNQLKSENAVDQTKARQAIENEAKVPGQEFAPPAYLDAYTQILDGLLQKLATDPSARVRLNAGIAAANVAQVAPASDHLKNTALVLVNDKNDAVVLWGVKAAKSIIPAQLSGPRPDLKLVDAVVQAVQNHPKGVVAGGIVTEAYDALTLNIINKPTEFAKFPAAAKLKLIPSVLKLMQARIQQYRRGVPPFPQAEAVGARFLTDPNVWPLSPKDQPAVMQTLSDIIALAGKQAQAANAADRVALAITVQKIARALQAVPAIPPNVAQALGPAAGLAQNAKADDIAKAAEAVLAALKQFPGFSGLQNAPDVVGNEPAPPPASAPTTGPVTIPGAGVLPPAPAAPPGAATRPAGARPTPPTPPANRTNPTPPGATGTPPR
jgi:hypothetical protein